MYQLSERSKQNIDGVDPRLIEISALAITITTVDFGHDKFAGLRNTSMQQYLFANGASKADGIIKKSDHQDGRAIDFFAFVNGKASWERPHLSQVACAFLQAASMLGYAVGWGGLYKPKPGEIYGWDMPHIYLIEK